MLTVSVTISCSGRDGEQKEEPKEEEEASPIRAEETEAAEATVGEAELGEARFRISSPQLSPDTVIEGEPATLAVDVASIGDQAGEYQVVLIVDDKEVETQREGSR